MKSPIFAIQIGRFGRLFITWCILFTAWLQLAACTAPTPQVTPSEIPQSDVTDIAGARSASLAVATNGMLYLAIGLDQSILVSSSADGGLSFSDPVLATGNSSVHVLPVERPALATSGEETVAVAWLEQSSDYTSATIWYAESTDNGVTFSKPIQAASEQGTEIVMVQLAFDEKGNPVLAWLNDAALRFARSSDSGESFTSAQSIGDGACECCQPQILVRGDQVLIVYRGLETTEGADDIRDIVVARSESGGQTFEPFTSVSDKHWYLNACPIAGPAFASYADNFYVAWMDAREAEPGTQYNGSIWFAVSRDSAQSFSPNLKINPTPGVHQTLPVMAVNGNGRIYLAWEIHENSEQSINYAFSDDEGNTFTAPVSITTAGENNGSPRMPSLAALPTGEIYLAWLDNSGAHIQKVAD